jgi:DNA replication ATP-dependent helicase Dna2
VRIIKKSKVQILKTQDCAHVSDSDAEQEKSNVAEAPTIEPIEDEIVFSQGDFQLETIHSNADRHPRPFQPTTNFKTGAVHIHRKTPKKTTPVKKQLSNVLPMASQIVEVPSNDKKRKSGEDVVEGKYKKSRVVAVSTAPSSPIASGLSDDYNDETSTQRKSSVPSVFPPQRFRMDSNSFIGSLSPSDSVETESLLDTFKFNRMHVDRYHRLRVVSVNPECPSLQEVVAAVQRKKFLKYTTERRITVVSPKNEKGLENDPEHRDERVVVLRGSWVNMTPVQRFDIIHVIGSFNYDTQTGIDTCVIDDKNGFIITNPDHLVSATDASSCNPCLRKIFLRNKVEYKNIRRDTDKLQKMGCSSVNSTQIYGTMLHEIFQLCLDRKNFSRESLKESAEEALKKQFVILSVLQIPEAKARTELEKYFDGFCSWADTFVGRSALGGRVKHFGSTNGSIVKVTELYALEESVWSPMYGLKGYIDLSVEVAVTSDQSGHSTKQVIPIELKSGRCDIKYNAKGKMDHRAQVLMYLLMMSDKYDREITNGILYYFKESQLFGVDKVQSEVKAILQMRNLLASSLINAKITRNNTRQSGSLDVASNSSQQAKSQHAEQDIEDIMFDIKYLTPEPPPMLREPRECKYCYMLNTCSLYHRVFENGTAETSNLGEEFEVRTNHLTEDHLEYMKKWITCLDLESLEMNHFRKEMWSMTGPEREKVGRCISCMVVVEEGAMNMGIYQYRMRRHERAPKISLKSIGIDVDSYVTISTESGHISVSSGYLVEMSDTEIVVKLKRELKVDDEPEDCLYRIDLDEYEIQYKHQRGMVLSLFDHEPINNNVVKIRELVVEKRRPKFKQVDVEIVNSQDDETEAIPYLPELEKIQVCDWFHEKLNDDQRMAIERVLRADDYTLILGMPGTGKTTTIVYIVKALLELGKKVLVTAHTHTAVDNMLIKMKEIGINDMVRIGRKKDVNPQLYEFVIDSNTSECCDGRIDTTKKLDEMLANRHVFGATCLATDPLLQIQGFDCCIVDEASQITHTECIGPLLYAKTFVLVGDHNQLPPLVKNNVAREMGMGESLFKSLSDLHGDIAMVALSNQYRMNSQVLTLCNKLVYSNSLKCGNESVANGKLYLPIPTITNRQWLNDIISPDSCVMFVNTDKVANAKENRLGNKIFNSFEVELVFEIVEALLGCGCEQQSIGVMSPFRSQVIMIRTKLGAGMSIQCNTIDKFQGLDSDVTIISLVRSNNKREINELLRERSRLNVALTRARHKLVIIGSLSTFEEHEPYKTLWQFMHDKGWIYDMPLIENVTEPSSLSLARNEISLMQTSDDDDDVMIDEERSTPVKVISSAVFNIANNDVIIDEIRSTPKRVNTDNPFIKNLKTTNHSVKNSQADARARITQKKLLADMVSFKMATFFKSFLNSLV